MSGTKAPVTRTITASRYDELMRDSAKARNQEETIRILERINRELESRISTANSRISDATRRADAANAKAAKASAEAKEMSNKLTATIKATQQALELEEAARKKEIANIRADVANDIKKTKADLENIINTKTNALAKAMADQQKANDKRMDNLKKDIDNIRVKLSKTDDDLAKLLEMAGVYRDSAKALIDTIEETDAAHREALLPGEWNKVQTAINNAESDIKQSETMPINSTNAFDSARAMFDAAQDYYTRLALAELEWQETMETAKAVVAAAQANAEGSLSLTVEGEVYDDADEWSDGSLGEVIEQAKGLANTLENNGAKMSIDELKGVIANAKDLAKEADDARTWAFIGIEKCGERSEKADDIAAELENECALTLVDDGFQGEKEQAANMIRLENAADGLVVSIEFIPEECDGVPSFTVKTNISTENIVNAAAKETLSKNLTEKIGKILKRHGLVSIGNAPIEDNPEAVKAKDGYEKQKATTKATRTNRARAHN